MSKRINLTENNQQENATMQYPNGNEGRPRGNSIDSDSNMSGTTQTTVGSLSGSSSHNNHISKSERKQDEIYDVQWVNDAEVESCMICHLDFSLLRRRHHCRVCGIVVCGQCSQHRKSVYGLLGLQRVCEECMSNGVWVAPKRDGVPVDRKVPMETSESVLPLELSKADLTEIYREHVIKFYKIYAPRRLSRVDALIEKYKDGLEEMYRALHMKYNVPYERIDVTKFPGILTTGKKMEFVPEEPENFKSPSPQPTKEVPPFPIASPSCEEQNNQEVELSPNLCCKLM